METIFLKTENNKTNESQKFVLSLPQKLDLRSSVKNVALQNLSIYYTWKNIRQLYENSKLKIIAPSWNKRNGKRFNNHVYSLFFIMSIFLKHLIDSKYIKMTGLQDFY